MNPDIALGVSSELRFLLKDGWLLQQDVERFRINPPSGSSTQANFKDILYAEVWRVAQFVAYANFVSITKRADGGYVIVSRMASGDGFEIDFEPT